MKETEQLLVFAINLINQKYHCNSLENIPYTLYVEGKKITEIKSDLGVIAKRTSNSLFKYKVYDFLWILFKDYQSALTAFHGFANIICNSILYKQNICLFNRCASIYIFVKQEKLDFNFQKILFRLIDLGKEDDTYCQYRILELAYEKQFLTVTQVITPIVEKLSQYESWEKWNLFLDMSNLYEKVVFAINKKEYTPKATKIEDIISIRRKRADYYLSEGIM